MAHIQLIGLAERKSPDNKIWKFPYAFPVIVRELQKSRHTFDALDMHLHKKTPQDVIEFLEKSEAKIYGISAWSHNYSLVKKMAQVIRQKHRNSIIITGGILSGNDDVLMKSTEVDIVVTGPEGEFILPGILDALDSGRDFLYQVRGITFRDKKRNKIIKTQTRSTSSIEEYQLQDRPAYEYFHKELMEMITNINSRDDLPVRGFPLLTSRGCPFHCTFCGHMHGRRFLRKNWPAFFSEVEFLIDNYGARGFYSYDTNMFLNEKDVKDFCDIYKERGHTFTMCIELRPTFGDYDMFRKLYDHGVRVVLFGFESGSQYMLNRMKKEIDIEKMKSVVKVAVDAGLIIHGNFVFGIPGEDTKTIAETRKFMMLLEKWIYEQKIEFRKRGEINTSGYGWSCFVPSPTSELYSVAIKNNLISDEESFLSSLGDEDGTRLLKGSNFKIALCQIGGDVNMSKFRSKSALISYVKFNNNLVNLYAYLWLGRYKDLKEWGGILKSLFATVIEYCRYIYLTAFNSLQGKRGFWQLVY